MEDHLQSLNIFKNSIVKKYREGKVKRPCKGVWNRTWNLMLETIDVKNFMFLITMYLLYNGPTT